MGATKTVKKTEMTTAESRAHNAAHKEKRERARKREVKQKQGFTEKKYDEQTARYDAEQEMKQQREAERKQRQGEQDAERAQRQSSSDAENEARKVVQKNQQVLKGVSGVVDGITPDTSSKPLNLGSTSWSLGAIFLGVLVVFWLTLNKAPSHNNSSRATVMWNAIVGKEKIA